jgi:hypothetical protein
MQRADREPPYITSARIIKTLVFCEHLCKGASPDVRMNRTRTLVSNAGMIPSPSQGPVGQTRRIHFGNRHKVTPLFQEFSGP